MREEMINFRGAIREIARKMVDNLVGKLGLRRGEDGLAEIRILRAVWEQCR